MGTACAQWTARQPRRVVLLLVQLEYMTVFPGISRDPSLRMPFSVISTKGALLHVVPHRRLSSAFPCIGTHAGPYSYLITSTKGRFLRQRSHGKGVWIGSGSPKELDDQHTFVAHAVDRTMGEPRADLNVGCTSTFLSPPTWMFPRNVPEPISGGTGCGSHRTFGTCALKFPAGGFRRIASDSKKSSWTIALRQTGAIHSSVVLIGTPGLPAFSMPT